MKTFICKVCGHVAFDQAHIVCPVCNAPIEEFENNPEAIKMPVDPKNLNETEKKHIPQIIVSRDCDLITGGGCINVHVKIGEIEHIMDNEHYITFIDFYINKRFLSRINLTYKRLHPAVLLHLGEQEGILAVVENCNIHGNWMAEVKI